MPKGEGYARERQRERERKACGLLKIKANSGGGVKQKRKYFRSDCCEPETIVLGQLVNNTIDQEGNNSSNKKNQINTNSILQLRVFAGACEVVSLPTTTNITCVLFVVVVVNQQYWRTNNENKIRDAATTTARNF